MATEILFTDQLASPDMILSGLIWPMRGSRSTRSGERSRSCAWVTACHLRLAQPRRRASRVHRGRSGPGSLGELQECSHYHQCCTAATPNIHYGKFRVGSALLIASLYCNFVTDNRARHMFSDLTRQDKNDPYRRACNQVNNVMAANWNR